MVKDNNFVCRRCGKCCSQINIKLTAETDEKQEDLEKWASYHRHVDVVDGVLVIHAKCKHLGYKNGQHYCKIYKHRPEMCKDAGEKQCLRNEDFEEEEEVTRRLMKLKMWRNKEDL